MKKNKNKNNTKRLHIKIIYKHTYIHTDNGILLGNKKE